MRIALRAMARRVGAVVAECNYAQRRVTMIQARPGQYLLAAGQAPDTYQEFLFRTAGPLVHEPPAAKRHGPLQVG
ncbi:MAG TPA: hypothetical protein VMI33_27335 [Streptosporangiaceae bacterium]|nr:hypothetical protein [Streptosporangiaceae bacterium]